MEGVTFHDTAVAKLLRDGFVEARLHMDGEDALPADKFALQRVLQQELIGQVAVPQYAVLDATSGEFLARHQNQGAPGQQWATDFQALLGRF